MQSKTALDGLASRNTACARTLRSFSKILSHLITHLTESPT